MSEADQGAEVVAKTLKLERTYPADLKSYFVNNIVVQHEPDRFVLTFFEVFPPPVLGETEQEARAELQKLESVEARCVARLVVTPQKMKEFLRALNENMRKYEELLERLARERGKEE